ncbi:magnesium and cobalt transport protein CorA [Galactobacter caseinivorans]|uniref:Magnesium and cobalt transport protein CorA n=2 Tax=Galactobacter caseinivorans TaxID=2676123 RepID=A0A496PFT4_9MICC|nr:magnesium and cobalt transport protein CorA [Galactobacter caseinivorans]
MGQQDLAERVSVFVDGTVTELESRDREAIRSARDRGGWIWVELAGTSKDQWHLLAQDFTLNHLAVEDMMESKQRTKVDHYGEDTFLVMHPACYDEDAESVSVGELHLYAGRDFLITHRDAGTPAPDQARQRVVHSPALAGLGPRGGAYSVLDQIVDDYEPVVDELATDIEQIDEELFAQSQGEVATRIYKLSRQVGHFQRAVQPLDDALIAARKNIAGDDPGVLLGEAGVGYSYAMPAAAREPKSAGTPGSGHDQDAAKDSADQRGRVLIDALLRDVQDHSTRVEARLDGMHATLVNALSLALTLASERAAQVGLEQSVQSKKVSSWAAILAAPTVLAGVWGMNFKYMPELEAGWGYPAALATMLGAGTTLYVVFKKKGWL